MVKHISHEIMVMYLGQCVEYAKTEDLFKNPLHPYTCLLYTSRFGQNGTAQAGGHADDVDGQAVGEHMHPVSYTHLTTARSMAAAGRS